MSKDAILFDAAARISNGSEELPAWTSVSPSSRLGTCRSCFVVMLWINMWENLKDAVSADQVNGLSDINAMKIKGHPLLYALILELSNGEDHVYRWTSSSEAKCPVIFDRGGSWWPEQNHFRRWSRRFPSPRTEISVWWKRRRLRPKDGKLAGMFQGRRSGPKHQYKLCRIFRQGGDTIYYFE